MSTENSSVQPTPPHTTTDWRFAPIPEALLYDTKVDPLCVRVYGALMRHGLNPASCYPSQKRLAGLIGVSPRSVARPLKDLEEAGWISRTKRFAENGEQVSDGYHVFTHRATERDPHADERGGGAPASAPKESNLTKEPNAEVDHFDAFWAAYPRKQDKGTARRAWKAALKKVKGDHERIIRSATAYAKAKRGTDPQYVKLPATWLNAEPWLDEPTAEAKRPMTELEYLEAQRAMGGR